MVAWGPRRFRRFVFVRITSLSCAFNFFMLTIQWKPFGLGGPMEQDNAQRYVPGQFVSMVGSISPMAHNKPKWREFFGYSFPYTYHESVLQMTKICFDPDDPQEMSTWGLASCIFRLGRNLCIFRLGRNLWRGTWWRNLCIFRSCNCMGGRNVPRGHRWSETQSCCIPCFFPETGFRVDGSGRHAHGQLSLVWSECDRTPPSRNPCWLSIVVHHVHFYMSSIRSRTGCIW